MARARMDGAVRVRGEPAGVFVLLLVVVRRFLLAGLLRETGD